MCGNVRLAPGGSLSVVTIGTAALLGAALGGLAVRVWVRQASEDALGPPAVPIDDVPEAVVCCDVNFSIVESNRGLQQLLGYPPNIAKGLTLAQLSAETERQRVKRRLSAVTGPPAKLQVECRRVDGEPCSTEWHIARGTDDRWVICILPVRVGLTSTQARSLVKLREPLMTLVGTADELSSGRLPPQFRDSVQLIVRSTMQVSDAVDELSGTESSPSAVAPRRPPQALASQQAQPMVLVVEDNDVNALILRRCLTRLGLDSNRALDGSQALSMLDEPIYDAVLMDCQMPVMDGYEATRRIRSTPKLANLPVIAVTAHALETDRERCFQAGMDDHLVKPVRIHKLRAVLEQWIGPLDSTTQIAADNVVNLDTLGRLRSLLGDEFDATVRLFLTDAESALTVAEQAFETGDWEELGRAAHSLKSSSAYVGAAPVSETCSRVVSQARAENGNQMDDLLLGLRRGVTATAVVLKEQLD